jgi:hypothetical protein
MKEPRKRTKTQGNRSNRQILLYKRPQKIRFDQEINPENVGTAEGTVLTAAEKCTDDCRKVCRVVPTEAGSCTDKVQIVVNLMNLTACSA